MAINQGAPGLAPVPADLGRWSVAGIIEDLCKRAGVPRFDVDALQAHADGFSTTNEQSAVAALEDLAQTFLFDAANAGGTLRFVPRAGEPVLSLTDNDLTQAAKERTRGDSIRVPRIVQLSYFDTDGGLTPDVQTSDRSLDSRSRDVSKLETSVLMSADDAAKSATIRHKIAVEEARGEVSFKLPDAFIALTPADIIELNGARLRIVEVRLDSGEQSIRAVYDRKNAYRSNIQGLPRAGAEDPPDLLLADTVLHVFEAPPLADADDRLGFYVAVTPDSLNWQGAVVELARDGGQNWTDSEDGSSYATLGTLSAPLPFHRRDYRDDRNTLTVELARADMELLPATQAEMQNRANLALIGDELINFSSAVQTGETTWELSGLLRGRKHSKSSTHSAGERFILLDDQVQFIPAEGFDLGRTLALRATSYGAVPAVTGRQNLTLAGIQEPPPAYLKARRSGGQLLLNWRGTGRRGGGAQAKPSASFIGYRITLGGQSWDSAETHISIPYSSGTVTVQQVSSATGAGQPASIQV